MPRLIDADALSEELSTLAMMITGLRAGKGVLNEFMKEYRKSVLRIVDEQPTIDPSTLRPKGEWLDTGFENSTGKIYLCSACNKPHNPNKEDVAMDRIKEKPDFCPNCGADMRGEA